MSAEGDDEGGPRGTDKGCSSDVDAPSKRLKVQGDTSGTEAEDSLGPSLEPSKEVIFCSFL